MRIFAYRCLASIGLLPAVSPAATSGPQQALDRQRNFNASELVYRPWRAGDMIDHQLLKIYGHDHVFVAIDPKAEYDTAVAGYVVWRTTEAVPACVLSKINKLREDPVVAFIASVKVVPSWQNKRVGSAMLPRALANIREESPDAVAVFLTVGTSNEPAIKLYEKSNFTSVFRKSEDASWAAMGTPGLA
ncbi:hypothetical protein FOZ60_014035 [Perkinsus olseni]|uniref:N-acetyltransferase domain-containing protein n=1 Tax=Perkinsus olseni TaxID=32597 RepID=A0A7J6PJD8_PEROL|nr:hypothetical protein FOZ60_014035 [Perkinsus olseni]KAF4696243.1 hypothetical protein FOZ62_026296 [Perkinsus olseni]